VMPFLTEELWHRLPQPAGARSIALDSFPMPRPEWKDDAAERDMEKFQGITIGIRDARAEGRHHPKQVVPVEYAPANEPDRTFVTVYGPLLNLTTSTTGSIVMGGLNSEGRIVRSFQGLEIAITPDTTVDKQAEMTRLEKEIERLKKDIESKQKRLADDNFTSKAPAKVVEDLRKTLAERQLELKKLKDRLAQLS